MKMFKKLNFSLLIMFALVLIVSCAPQTTPSAPVDDSQEDDHEAEDLTETTGETSVDEVADDISDAGNIDEELDTSELDDVDSILEDIENI
jgi:hypothetical protein